MLLDPATIANLELLRGNRTGDPKQSLFGAVHNCLTAAGTRCLRAALIQPSTSLPTITARLDCVSELIERPDCLHDLRKILPAFSESDRLLKHFMQTPIQTGVAKAKAAVTAVLQLKAVLHAAPLLAAAMTSNGHAPSDNVLLHAMVRNLMDPALGQMATLIDEVVDEDATFCKKPATRMLECLNAVREGVSSFLDTTRTRFKEALDDMEKLGGAYSEQLGITDMRVNYTDRRGYHFVLPAQHKALVERHGFIRCASQAKKTIACSTDQLAQLNSRCKDMIGQILLSTEQQLSRLQDKIRGNMHILFSIGESVALLDKLQSFAFHVLSTGGAPFARPRMGDGGTLLLKQARHPILEAIGEAAVVPNDIMITHATNFQLITGPNMSGKSTYLRQAALAVLLAHCGCHVPAEAATIPLLRRVFTRIGASDSLESNGSTFACEMRETTYILRNLGDAPSLVLVDELGRGTSNRDGASLAWAIAEQLAMQPKAFTLFATHYLHLAGLKSYYPDHVRTLFLQVQPTDAKLHFLHKIADGVATKAQYMSDFLAEIAGFPSQVCGAAKRLAASVDFDPVHPPSATARTREAYALVAERLIWLRRSTTMDEVCQRCHHRLSIALPKTPSPPSHGSTPHLLPLVCLLSSHLCRRTRDAPSLLTSNRV